MRGTTSPLRGKYICIEGADGSGKTSLVDALSAEIDGAEQRFPSQGPIGSLIRSALMGKTSLPAKAFLYLFCADGFEQQPAIERALAAGYHVLCDRHPTLSGRVFQLEHHEAQEIEAVYIAAQRDGLLMPDLLVVLDAPADVLLARMKAREKYKDVVFEKDDIGHVELIRQRYWELGKRFNGVIADAELPLAQLVTIVKHYLDDRTPQTTTLAERHFGNDCG